MSILQRLASEQGRRDEQPNKELAEIIVRENNLQALSEIAENIRHSDKRIQADCLSVLEQTGLLSPELIKDYVKDITDMLDSRNNRLVWQSMIILAIIADLQAKELFAEWEKIAHCIKNGSVITKDNGIKTLAAMAGSDDRYSKEIFPFLLDQLDNCRPSSVPQYAESISTAVNNKNQESYLKILRERYPHLTPPQQKRIKKILDIYS
jgi:hypothetical protein